ncbi:hypothetical protein R3P38DRAFT_3185487 [Favolaschia claudopus]|uniref:Uncharacterized protein n=1 Tax=Favolaschia claudopus TaxID=2862362 RepID=A0AAW0C5R2_9AGAR
MSHSSHRMIHHAAEGLSAISWLRAIAALSALASMPPHRRSLRTCRVDSPASTPPAEERRSYHRLGRRAPGPPRLRRSLPAGVSQADAANDASAWAALSAGSVSSTGGTGGSGWGSIGTGWPWTSGNTSWVGWDDDDGPAWGSPTSNLAGWGAPAWGDDSERGWGASSNN